MSQFIEMFGDPVSWQTDTSLPTLNDTVNVISGFPFDSEKFDTEGVGTPLIRIRDIQRGYSETFTTEVFDEQYRIKKYELLVGMDGMFDIARWQSDEAALNQRVCCLRMKGSENDTFIQYLVQPILKHIENGTNATTVKHISTKQINGIRVPIASHEQKNKFAMIANQADKSGFVGFKSQFIEMFKCSAERVALSSLCDTFIDGDWIEAKDQSDSGIRLIQTGNVGVGTFKDKGDKARYISEDTFNRLNCTEVVEGDILISRLPDPVGRACIIPAELGKSITAVDCTIIRLNDKVLPKFFVAFTSTPDYAMQIKKVLSGTTRLRVSRANLGKIQVPLPSIDKQQQFVTIAEQADKSGSGGRESVALMDKVKKSLINYYNI